MSDAIRPGQYIEFAIGALFIVIYAFKRFNTPVNKDTAALASMYARDGSMTSTTRGRFIGAFLLYLIAMLALYYLFAADPRWVGAILSKNEISTDWSFSIPLMAALVLTVLVPSITLLSTPEQELRGFLQRIGSIPLIVQDIITELGGTRRPLTPPEETTISEVLQLRGITFMRAEPDSPVAKFYRSTLLLERLEAWKKSRVFGRYMRTFGDVFEYIRERHDDVVTALADEQSRAGSNLPARAWTPGRMINKQCAALEEALHEFVARGVLRSGLGDRDLKHELDGLGFSLAHGPSLSHRWALVFILTWAALVATFLVSAPFVGSYKIGELLYMCTTISSYFTVSVACGVAVTRRHLAASARRAEDPEGFPPFMQLLVRGLLAVVACSLLSLVFRTIWYGDYRAALFDYSLTYPYQALGFVTAVLTAWNCQTSATLGIWKLRGSWFDALLQAAVTGAASRLVAVWLLETRGGWEKRWETFSALTHVQEVSYTPSDPQPWIRLLIICTVIPFGIGYYVPSWFKAHKKRIIRGLAGRPVASPEVSR